MCSLTQLVNVEKLVAREQLTKEPEYEAVDAIASRRWRKLPGT
jgi:hypothetical protein